MTLLTIPNFKSPLNSEASELFKKSESEYKARVREWVKNYSASENIK